MDCHGCRASIPPADLEKRRAVIVLKKPYCRDCAEQITTRRYSRRPHRVVMAAAALLILCLLAALSWALA